MQLVGQRLACDDVRNFGRGEAVSFFRREILVWEGRNFAHSPTMWIAISSAHTVRNLFVGREYSTNPFTSAPP